MSKIIIQGISALLLTISVILTLGCAKVDTVDKIDDPQQFRNIHFKLSLPFVSATINASSELNEKSLEHASLVDEVNLPQPDCQSAEQKLWFMHNQKMWQIENFAFFISDLKIKYEGSNTWLATEFKQSPWQSKNTALLWFNTQCNKQQFHNTEDAYNHSVEILAPEHNVKKLNSMDTRAQKTELAEVNRVLDASVKQNPQENTNTKPNLTNISFELSVPFADNHQNPLSQASPLNIPEMFWNWRNGHKFLRLDLNSPSSNDSWSFHLGSLGCSSAASVRAPNKPCKQANRFRIEIELAANADEAVIDVHLKRLLTSIILTQEQSCMFETNQNQACTQLMENLRSAKIFDAENNQAMDKI